MSLLAPHCPVRRTFLAHSLAAAGLLTLAPLRALGAVAISNVTGLYTVQVARTQAPATTQDVVDALRSWDGKVSVGGGRYSMGGQVAIADGLHLDMRSLNRLVWLHADDKRVRVQAGMRWRDLQDVLDPVNLAVKTMQSYANFTVGGAVSVNAHGRYVGHGPVGNTVRALQLVLGDGAVVEATPTLRPELFRAAIGGYGAIGVITEVELELAVNVRIERVVTQVALADYESYFDRRVLADPRSVLHNADLLPPLFDTPMCTTWHTSDKPLTDAVRLVPRGHDYAMQRHALRAITELPGGERLGSSIIRPMLTSKPAVTWLNHEASLDVAELEPRSRVESTYVLQEYFVPRRHFVPFARALAPALRRGPAQVLNVSIRHSPADGVSALPWAKEEVFAFVVYFRQHTDAAALRAIGDWTRALIGLALAHEGRYYLPYQLHATPQQFARAYPEAAALRELKHAVDPTGKFSNALWARYL